MRPAYDDLRLAPLVHTGVKATGKRFLSMLKIHQDLPANVNPHPTLKGKRRFETLQAFNLVLGFYILLHKLIVPVAVQWLQTNPNPKPVELSFWYLYHFAIAFMLWGRFRSPGTAFCTVYASWFAVGYLPPALGASLFEGGNLTIQWKAISGVLCYGSSLVFTLYLLYRMRMPTTAYLFGIEGRIVPRLRYALPYFLLGLLTSLFWITRPTSPPAMSPAQPTHQKIVPGEGRAIYE